MPICRPPLPLLRTRTISIVDSGYDLRTTSMQHCVLQDCRCSTCTTRRVRTTNAACCSWTWDTNAGSSGSSLKHVALIAGCIPHETPLYELMRATHQACRSCTKRAEVEPTAVVAMIRTVAYCSRTGGMDAGSGCSSLKHATLIAGQHTIRGTITYCCDQQPTPARAYHTCSSK